MHWIATVPIEFKIQMPDTSSLDLKLLVIDNEIPSEERLDEGQGESRWRRERHFHNPIEAEEVKDCLTVCRMVTHSITSARYSILATFLLTPSMQQQTLPPPSHKGEGVHKGFQPKYSAKTDRGHVLHYPQ